MTFSGTHKKRFYPFYPSPSTGNSYVFDEDTTPPQ